MMVASALPGLMVDWFSRALTAPSPSLSHLAGPANRWLTRRAGQC